ncbi:LysR family transcriptional regulator [Paracoccus yeei]|nr:LysR substrate-binding domain-containing protein [Paracoccus yeei]
MAIKIEMLRSFLTVAEEGNIKDAATRLLRTPSSVSMTLSALEDELGGPLFEQDRKSRLTVLGTYVRDMAEVMIRDHDRGIETIKAFAQSRLGRLHIVAVPSVASRILPPILREFLRRQSGAAVSLVDTDSHQVQQMVVTGEADIGIGGPPPGKLPLSFAPLFEDPFRLVCAVESPLARLPRPLCWQDLLTEDLIVNESARAINAPEYAEMVDKARLTIRNITSLLAMVRANAGVTLLPALACTTLPAGLTALEIETGGVSRVVGLVQRSNSMPSPLATTFVKQLNEQLREVLSHSIGLYPSHVDK